MDTRRLEGRPSSELGLVAPRPPYSVLGSERGMLLDPLEEALERYFRDREIAAGAAWQPSGLGRTACPVLL